MKIKCDIQRSRCSLRMTSSSLAMSPCNQCWPGVQLFEACLLQHDYDGGMWKSRLQSQGMQYEGLKAVYEGADDEMVGTDNR